ncbi:MAG TPA: SRPBCC family protein [Chitinophagaceae bacterium]|nr:SRPBCC family protein [Chitinophagaceae bacterium]
MRIIKLAFISLILLSVVITVISLFIPPHIRVSRTVRINTTKEAVLFQLIDPVRWRDWYPGADTSTFFYENGKISGIILNKELNQYLAITEKKENEIITSFNDPVSHRKITSDWRVIPETDSNSVSVQWYMDFDLRWYPWEKFSSLMYDKSYGFRMELGLNNLKKLVELK